MSDTDEFLVNQIRELNAEVTALRILLLYVLAENDIPDNPVDRFRQSIQSRLDDGTVAPDWVEYVEETIRTLLSGAESLRRY